MISLGFGEEIIMMMDDGRVKGGEKKKKREEKKNREWRQLNCYDTPKQLFHSYFLFLISLACNITVNSLLACIQEEASTLIIIVYPLTALFSMTSSPPASSSQALANRTHYDTLTVSTTATPDEIKKAYRSLVVQCHPDKLTPSSSSCDFNDAKASSESSLMISKSLAAIDLDDDDDDDSYDAEEQTKTIEQSSSTSTQPEEETSKAAKAFHAIHTAYECLRDPNKRIQYDQSLSRDEERKEWKKKGATEVNLSDLESDMCCVVHEDDDESGGSGSDDQLQRVYFYNCRCGDTFEIFEEELLESTSSERVWQCESCSLGIRIVFDVDIVR